jgi:thioredoxin-like negative regulator of GroEL
MLSKEEKTGLLAIVIVLILYYAVNFLAYGINRNHLIYRFYRPTCGACRASQSEWDQFKARYKANHIKVMDVNMDNMADMSTMKLARQFNIQAVPTVVAVDDMGNYHIYNGVRTYDNYRRWAELL